MSEGKAGNPRDAKVDYSKVTPATGTHPDNREISDSLANQMPTADTPATERSKRSDPDKTIPGPEAASSVDAQAEGQACKGQSKCP